VLPVWLLAYGFKIYLDFSAYSDIAIRSARLFGIKVPENFDWPYLRTNISEFWQHWHMSLYKWLVDYVFIPLGGSRTAQPRVYLNVLITMLVSGLWHGAALNFVVWGLWHGMLLMIYRAWSRWRTKANDSLFGKVAAWALTFTMVNLGWAFFCMDLHTATFFFHRLFLG
jgi:alginate O-acetyltransferase complex protein AlgI